MWELDPCKLSSISRLLFGQVFSYKEGGSIVTLCKNNCINTEIVEY